MLLYFVVYVCLFSCFLTIVLTFFNLGFWLLVQIYMEDLHLFDWWYLWCWMGRLLYLRICRSTVLIGWSTNLHEDIHLCQLTLPMMMLNGCFLSRSTFLLIMGWWPIYSYYTLAWITIHICNHTVYGCKIQKITTSYVHIFLMTRYLNDLWQVRTVIHIFYYAVDRIVAHICKHFCVWS